MMTSLNQEWRTPRAIYEALDAEFHFDFDPCHADSVLDGTYCEWGLSNFVNPPYETKTQNAFVEKAVAEWRKGKTVVLLIPVRTASRRWQEWILPLASEIRFMPKRLKFNDGDGRAPFDSAVVVFRGVHD